MNSAYDSASRVAQCANGYNLDDLFNVILNWNSPAEVRHYLLNIYFLAAQSVFDDGAAIGEELSASFGVLQNLIEALEAVNDVKTARLAVTVK